MDLLVKAPVRARHRRRIPEKTVVVLNHSTQHPDLLGAGVLGGKPRGQTLQLGAHDIKLRKLVVVERGDDQAAPVARQHGLRLQTLQCLTHRRAGHAEPVGELGLDQTVAGTVDTAVDRFEDQRIGVLLGHRREFTVALRHGYET